MDDQKQQIVERLLKANNVLVTVSNNPSVDQLAACIGLTLALNKLDKHATAVFSGNIPSTIEFLQPDETLEKNTDSLRDFIISLDKSKADKLRYKVEDRIVRIFITPYRTSITDQDLEFSQGDFNVDVVLALGVREQKDLDQAITAHGRILHDATVVTINNSVSGDLGGINWLNTTTSSLSEMSTGLVNGLGATLMDQQIATALLTGIVAETDRFSNEKTTADTMNASAALMAAGANQQLVATKLQEPLEIEQAPLDEEMPADAPEPETEKLAAVQISEDGTLEIDHNDTNEPEPADTSVESPQESESVAHDDFAAIEPSAQDEKPAEELPKPPSESYANPRTAISSADAFSQPTFTSAAVPAAPEEPLLSSFDLPPVDTSTEPPLSQHTPDETLQELEKEVHSPHLSGGQSSAAAATDDHASGQEEELDLTKLERPAGIEPEPKTDIDIDAARNAVAEAMAGGGSTSSTPEPIAALNAQPLGGTLHPTPPAAEPEPLSPLIQPNSTPSNNMPTAEQPMTMPLPAVPITTPPAPAQQAPNPNAAPPVPPPILPFPQ